MATYYVSKSGNDNNEGTSEALAWLTVTKAFQTLQAGDTCYIAPGTYREKPVMSNAGADGNIILIQGDPDCEHFTNEHKGIIRITGCNTDEMADSEVNIAVSAQKDYVTLKNFLVDGCYRGVYQSGGNQRNCVNVITIAKYAGFTGGEPINCLSISGEVGYYQSTSLNCIAIANKTGFDQQYSTNCISISGSRCFSGGTVFNCLGISADYGFSNTISYNCLAIGSYSTGFQIGTANNGLAVACYRGYYGTMTADDCKYTMCSNISSGTIETSEGHEGLTEAPIMLWTLSTYQKIIEAFKPWMFEGAKQWGTTSGITVPDTDILGLPRQMIGGGLDIGPYAYTVEEADWSTYSTDAPSIKISQKGAKVFKLPAEVGTAITITCKCKHQNTSGDKPQLILKGESISEQTDTCINDTDTWDTLTVSATPTKDEELEVILYARDTGSIAVAYFSDIEVS